MKNMTQEQLEVKMADYICNPEHVKIVDDQTHCSACSDTVEHEFNETFKFVIQDILNNALIAPMRSQIGMTYFNITALSSDLSDVLMDFMEVDQ